MAKGEKPAYRLMIVRENAELKDENGNKIELPETAFINLGGLWSKDEGKASGAFQPSVKTKSGEYVNFSELTIKAGEFVNLLPVKQD